MLNESLLEKYADVLLWGLRTARRERFRKRNVILIQYDHAALKLSEMDGLRARPKRPPSSARPQAVESGA